MATRISSDRILTAADIARIEAECEERRAKVDPRNIYTISYTVGGYPMTESIPAFTTVDAIAQIKQQCGMVGWQPMNIKIVDTKLAAEVNA